MYYMFINNATRVFLVDFAANRYKI